MDDHDVVPGEVMVGGIRRSFVVRLPAGPARDQEGIPLALVLHGNDPSAGGSLMREWTTFDRQSDAWGFAVVYPDGYQGSWADGRGVTSAEAAGVDDVAFLRAIVEWAAERHGTQTDRVLVAGISGGAFMAHRFALEANDQVAVLGAVAGCLPASLLERRRTHAVSALLIHGTADKITRIGGGASRRRGPNGELRGRTLSLEETAAYYRAINRCSPESERTYTTEASSRTLAEGGVGGTQVAAWTVIGGGHAWPGTPVPPEWGEPNSLEFDAAEEICRFAEPLLLSPDSRRL